MSSREFLKRIPWLKPALPATRPRDELIAIAKIKIIATNCNSKI